MGYSSCQEPAPSMEEQLPSGTSPCSGMGSSPGCGWGSAPPWASMAAGTACPTMVCSMAAGDPLLQRLEHLLPSFCTDPGLCRAAPLTAAFLPFLKYLITEAAPALLNGSALASWRSVWSWLETALSDMIQLIRLTQLLLSSHRATPAAPCSQNLDR